MAHVYILRCSDDSYYVGSTVDLEQRIQQHSMGLGAEYTKRRLPVILVFAYEYERVADAFAMEKRIQGWSRRKREALRGTVQRSASAQPEGLLEEAGFFDG